MEQTRKAIGKLKTSKSFGDNSISSFLLQLAVPFIEDSLVDLFNNSLETSQFPDPWKIARVSSVFKNGDNTEKSTIGQYRCYLLSPGSLKNLSSTSCTGICMTVVSSSQTSLVVGKCIPLLHAY